MIMHIFDDVASVLFHVIMTHGQHEEHLKKLLKAFEKLENLLN
jgi:hypothetical protein